MNIEPVKCCFFLIDTERPGIGPLTGGFVDASSAVRLICTYTHTLSPAARNATAITLPTPGAPACDRTHCA